MHLITELHNIVSAIVAICTDAIYSVLEARRRCRMLRIPWRVGRQTGGRAGFRTVGESLAMQILFPACFGGRRKEYLWKDREEEGFDELARCPHSRGSSSANIDINNLNNKLGLPDAKNVHLWGAMQIMSQ
jgi:hypothetical protein